MPKHNISMTLLVLLAITAIATGSVGQVHMNRTGLTNRARSILREGAHDKNVNRRSKAIHALGLVPRNSEAQKLAEQALADEKPEVRAAAATALGSMGAQSARVKLEDALNDKEPAVVVAAANSLYLLNDRAAAFDVYYQVLTGERKSADGAVHSQLEALKDPKAVAEIGFEAGIGILPFAGAGYEAFKRLTKNDPSAVRAAAAQKLATDPDARTTQALAKACLDKKWQVRAAVVDAIAKRQDPAMINSITALLNDNNDTVRYDAAAAVLRLNALSRPHGSKGSQK